MVRIRAFQVRGLGSIPRRRIIFYIPYIDYKMNIWGISIVVELSPWAGVASVRFRDTPYDSVVERSNTMR